MKHHDGFTLVELLLANSLFVFVLFVVYFFNQYWQANLAQGFGRSQASVDAFRTVSKIAAEVRETEPGESGQYPLEQADNQGLTFYADVDQDGLVERVRYFLSGDELIRGEVKPQGMPATYSPTNEVFTTVAGYVANGTRPLFTYYNQDWPTDPTTNPLQSNRALATRYILTTIYIRSEDTPTLEPIVASQGAHLRAIKTNY